MILHALDLRRYLVVALLEHSGEASVTQLADHLVADGFSVAGRAGRTASDAFRAETRRGRVVRIDRGVYAIGRLPRTTKHRMIQHVAALRAARGCRTLVEPPPRRRSGAFH